MISAGHLNIAVIGNEDLVNMLRLAGIRRYYLIEDNGNTGEDVRTALSELIGDPGISIVALQEDYAGYVEDMIAQLVVEKRLTPVVIEVPSKSGTKYLDVAEYYKAFIRKFVGFEIEI